MKVNFYIDGFNFYYGLKRMSEVNPLWKKYYWLDIVKLCNNYLDPSHTLQKVKYFTAPPINEGKRKRQETFLKANKILNGEVFEVINGKYIVKDIKCYKCNETFERPEEKITDVNIATQIMRDCYLDDVDRVVLLTADSDLLPPMKFILNDVKSKKLKLIFPPKSDSSDLFNYMKENNQRVSFMERNETFFSNSMLPDKVEVGDSILTRPANWI